MIGHVRNYLEFFSILDLSRFLILLRVFPYSRHNHQTPLPTLKQIFFKHPILITLTLRIKKTEKMDKKHKHLKNEKLKTFFYEVCTKKLQK